MSTRFRVLVLLAAIAGLVSCKNNDNVFTPRVSSFFKMINASSDTLNYYLNGTRLNNGSSLAPGNATFYLVVQQGNENFQFKRNGQSDMLFSVPEKLQDSVNYSLYITGPSAGQTFGTIDQFNPDQSTAADTLTQARFVNASPDAGNLNVYIGDTLKYQALPFKSSSGFITFGKGLKRVRVYLPGSANATLDTAFVMEDHRIYTIYTHGLTNGTHAARFNVDFTLNY